MSPENASTNQDQDPKKETRYLIGPAPKLKEIDPTLCSGTVSIEFTGTNERGEPFVDVTILEKMRRIFEGLPVRDHYHYFEMSEAEFVQDWQQFFADETIFNPSFPTRLAFKDNVQYLTNKDFEAGVHAIAQSLIDHIQKTNQTILVMNEIDRSTRYVTTHVLQQVIDLVKAMTADEQETIISKIKLVNTAAEAVDRIKNSDQQFEILYIDDFVITGTQVQKEFAFAVGNLFGAESRLNKSDAQRVHLKKYCIAGEQRSMSQGSQTMDIVPAYAIIMYDTQEDGRKRSIASAFGSWSSTDYGFEFFIGRHFGTLTVPPLRLKGRYEREHISQTPNTGRKQLGQYLDTDLEQKYFEVVEMFGFD